MGVSGYYQFIDYCLYFHVFHFILDELIGLRVGVAFERTCPLSREQHPMFCSL